ncbi:hypothetical protein B0H10DRAFT_2198528 [Mycena sp. CBHHK59/15]|nr:hypothetical protein B0H10DRAFT_2198528 [Mycena sp. CBHHK59/15]
MNKPALSPSLSSSLESRDPMLSPLSSLLGEVKARIGGRFWEDSDVDSRIDSPTENRCFCKITQNRCSASGGETTILAIPEPRNRVENRAPPLPRAKKKPSTRIKTPTAKAPKKPKKKNHDSSEDSADEEKKKKEFKALDVDWKDPHLSMKLIACIYADKGIKQSLYPPCGPNASTTNGGGKPKVTARRNVLRTSRTRRWREESRGMVSRIELRIELRTGGVKVDVDSRSILPAESVKNRHQNRPESAVDSSFDFPY